MVLEKSEYLSSLAQDLARGSDFVRQPLHQQIAEKIEAMIKTNGLEPGSQLPSEYEIGRGAQSEPCDGSSSHVSLG